MKCPSHLRHDTWFDTFFFCPECDTEIEIRFKPERPAPACSDHDSPAFSDDGDPADIEYPDVCPGCGEDLAQYEDAIYNKAAEASVDYYEEVDRDDYYEDRS